MDNFEYVVPTRVIFGHQTELKVGEIIKGYGYKKILIHYGQGSIKKDGLLDKIVQSLKTNNIEYIELGGVHPNPDIELVRTAIKLCHTEHIDMILAVGGGSVIDSAKLTAAGFYYDGDPFDISLHKYVPKKVLPVGVLLTISAAGSETSTSCVITNEKTKTKMGYNHPLNRPLFAIMDPELTFTVSPYQTACGIVDIMMHTLERYFNESKEPELADALSEGLLRAVMEAGTKVMKHPNDYDARACLMMAGSLSHNGLTNLGKMGRMPVHQLEHVVSGLYTEVAHGAGLSVLFPAWAFYYAALDIAKFDKFAKNVMNIHLEKPSDNAKMGIIRLKEYFHSLGMPLTFSELGIKNPDIEWMVNKLTEGGTRVVDHHIKPLDAEVAKAIYTSVL
ncbi:MAG: iron-containing alcohol dehydrogenase [Firmicutes bacterium]|nr:iron-containing alcohol dehydrogenase [Bacillota bacterium]